MCAKVIDPYIRLCLRTICLNIHIYIYIFYYCSGNFMKMNLFHNELNLKFDHLLLCRLNIPHARLTDINDVPNEYNRIKSS